MLEKNLFSLDTNDFKIDYPAEPCWAENGKSIFQKKANTREKVSNYPTYLEVIV